MGQTPGTVVPIAKDKPGSGFNSVRCTLRQVKHRMVGKSLGKKGQVLEGSLEHRHAT